MLIGLKKPMYFKYNSSQGGVGPKFPLDQTSLGQYANLHGELMISTSNKQKVPEGFKYFSYNVYYLLH